MFTHSQYVALLLAGSFAAVEAVSLPKYSSATPVTTTVTQSTHSVQNIIVSTAATASALPTAAVLQNSHGSKNPGRFGATLNKKTRTRSSNTNQRVSGRGLNPRDNFDANITGDWLAVIEIGTPPQTLELLLDLGSDGFVVESTLIEEAMQTTQFPIYDPDNSTTAKQIDGYTWEYYYGGVTLEGVIMTDVVTMGENSWSNMTMEVVNGEPLGTPVETFSGILGLAAHLTAGASPSYVNSFLGSIMDQLADVVFTLWFDPVKSEGTIEFGAIDDSKYTGEIAYTPLYNAGDTTFWSVNVSGIGAADPETGALLYSNMTQFTAILDTGSGQSQLPLAALWGYYGGIPGSIFDNGGGCWDYDCSVGSSLPDLVLFIEDKPVVIPRVSYGYWESMNPANGEEGVSYCTAHMRPSEYFNAGTNMIGSDLIEGLFLVLDWQNQRVGFANSTAMETDSSFSIPGSSSGGGGSTPSSCNYTTSDPTIDPYITGCTGSDFDGACSQIEVNYPGCTALNSSLALVSVTPTGNSNMRCTFHSDDVCKSPLSDATDVTYPGVGSLSETAGSVSCISVGTEPEGVDGATMVYCGEGLEDTSGCWITQQDPWTCSTIYNPPEEFQFNVTSMYHFSGGNLGTCYYFQDTHCGTIVSSATGIDMCGSDTNGDTLDVALDTYVGSIMCV